MSTLTPDKAVTAKEDELVKSINGMEGFRLDDDLPFRAGHGTLGISTTLLANYVEIRPGNQNNPLILYSYGIEIKPQQERDQVPVGRARQQIVRLAFHRSMPDNLQKNAFTDYSEFVYFRTKPRTASNTVAVEYQDENETEPRPNPKRYNVMFNFTKTISIQDLVSSVSCTNPSDPSFRIAKGPLLQVLNTFLNHHARLNYKSLRQIGGNRTFLINNAAECLDLAGGLVLMLGFIGTVRAATNRILVNVQVKHGVFYQDGQLGQLMSAFTAKVNNIALLGKFLRRVRVLTTHILGKSGKQVERIHTIAGLATLDDGKTGNHKMAQPPRVPKLGAGPKDVSFWLSDDNGGRYISVYDFFKMRYGITLSQCDLPVVNVKSKRNPTYLPAELCRVIRGQPAMKKLSSSQTQTMIRYAVKKPQINQRSILSHGLKIIGLDPKTNPKLGSFGIQVNPKLVPVQGRILQAPKVLYQGQKAATLSKARAWNLSGFRFQQPGELSQWAWMLVSVPGFTHSEDLGYFEPHIRRFRRSVASTGIVMSEPAANKHVRLHSVDDPELDGVIKRAAGRYQMLFVILPKKNSIYKRIKHLGDVKYGIVTCHMVADSLVTKGNQYCANVAAKVNLKLTGRNQEVERTRLPIVSDGCTMIIGADVTHPTAGISQDSAPSIAALVSNIDAKLAQWPAALSVQDEAREEMISGLKAMLVSRLQSWVATNKQHPQNIIYYRDGVSEGQYELVISHELALLREACKEIYPPEATKKDFPRISIIIGGKRHHSRFYPTQAKHTDKNNPLPGTVVDRGVLPAERWSFFALPHSALQGTARPTHYTVIHDEVFRTAFRENEKLRQVYKNAADLVEDLTHSLSYTYGRATLPVSLCTPIYYAHLACERARCYLSNLYDTSPDVSVDGSSAQGQTPLIDMNAETKLHGRLKDIMFYI
ncbi:uncharacterized protein JN550_011930 [Neoarthrinium moseri]|uniref:uncharacterized protein n=1 Tax=Neoarthrinium moseri TaxID=1658444 RepID=UPI001FDDE576|nr:uncharacterized protein JN550_011930 [Neoarthrinium moseri]KAI1859622.1 hypothetical protein JN550_011930 [Neoarthrinium moseri]